MCCPQGPCGLLEGRLKVALPSLTAWQNGVLSAESYICNALRKPANRPGTSPCQDCSFFPCCYRPHSLVGIGTISDRVSGTSAGQGRKRSQWFKGRERWIDTMRYWWRGLVEVNENGEREDIGSRGGIFVPGGVAQSERFCRGQGRKDRHAPSIQEYSLRRTALCSALSFVRATPVVIYCARGRVRLPTIDNHGSEPLTGVA